MKHILLTGKPRSGKTTLLKQIIKELKIPAGGFYTEEILNKDDERIGFKIKTLDGKEGILARMGLESEYRLGKYGIDLLDLEGIGIKAIEEAIKNKKAVVIDEIGKMELFSQKFKDAVLAALDSGKRVIGVIHREDSEFLQAIRSRPDVLLFKVHPDNHRPILERIKMLKE